MLTTDTPVATYPGRPLATLVDADRDGDKDLVAVFDKQALAGNGDVTAAPTQLVLRGKPETH